MSHHRARLPRDPQLLAAGRYALAAAATEQFDFAAALAHKQICLLALPRAPPRPSADWSPPVSQVATHAQLKGRKSHLGVVYDQVVRRAWTEKTAAGVAGFTAHRPAPARARARSTDLGVTGEPGGHRPGRGAAPPGRA